LKIGLARGYPASVALFVKSCSTDSVWALARVLDRVAAKIKIASVAIDPKKSL
jgi:hypothetical protein